MFKLWPLSTVYQQLLRESESGKPHPLESAVSRQLDSIDIDDDDDWGLQEVRASSDIIPEGTDDSATSATDQTSSSLSAAESRREVFGEKKQSEKEFDAVDG